jgi:hypothetical protein
MNKRLVATILLHSSIAAVPHYQRVYYINHIVTIIVFLNKEIQFTASDDEAPLSARLLDVGPTHACTPPPSLTPATTAHLHHQLRPPHTGALPAAHAYRLPNHHRGCCLDACTTSSTCLGHHPHVCMGASVCSKQLSALRFLSRSVPTLKSEVVLNQRKHNKRSQ